MEESEERSGSITRQSSRSKFGLLSQSHSLLHPRQGLLSQTGELLSNPTIHSQSRMGSAHSASSSRNNSVPVQQGNYSRVSANQPSTSSAQERSDQSNSIMAETVTDLRQTLTNTKLVLQFRQFLRTKIDRNKSDDPQYK